MKLGTANCDEITNRYLVLLCCLTYVKERATSLADIQVGLGTDMVPLCLRKARENLVSILDQCCVLVQVIHENSTILHDILKDAKRLADAGYIRSFDTESVGFHKELLHDIEVMRNCTSEVRANLEAFPAIMSESINMVLGKLSTDVATAGRLLDSEGALVRIPMVPRSILSSADSPTSLGASRGSSRSSFIMAPSAGQFRPYSGGRIQDIVPETPRQEELVVPVQASIHAGSTVASDQEEPLLTEQGYRQDDVRAQAEAICEQLNAEAWRPVKGPWLERMSNLLRQYPPTAPQAEPPVTEDDLQSVYRNPGGALQLRSRFGNWSELISDWAPDNSEEVADGTVSPAISEIENQQLD